MNWIHCRLSFALFRASIMSIREARSSRRHPATEGTLGPIDLQLAEGRIYYIITSVIFALLPHYFVQFSLSFSY